MICQLTFGLILSFSQYIEEKRHYSWSAKVLVCFSVAVLQFLLIVSLQ